MKFKSGFVTIIGSPNVGKSTLINAIVGQKIVIVSRRPQTTRNRVLGIKHLKRGQIVFMDTPGIHRSKGLLNKFMVRLAMETLNEVDIVVYVVDNRAVSDSDLFIMERLKKTDTPVILCINKIDKLRPDTLLPRIAGYADLFDFREIIPISALHNKGLDRLVQTILHILPEGPRYFPDNTITGVPERFIAAEIIREKIIESVKEEVPYSVMVTVEEFRDDPLKNILSIIATIYVERDSQKGIIIGRRGGKLKQIGIVARRDLERLFASKVYLNLLVAVKKDWTKDIRRLKEFGYC